MLKFSKTGWNSSFLNEFEQLTDNSDSYRSKLNMHVIYESVAQRDQMLQLPFAQGINMAHNRLQEIISKINNSTSSLTK